MTEPDAVKQPDLPAMPGSSSPPAGRESPGRATASGRASVPEAGGAAPRVARGRGEPRRTAPARRQPKSAIATAHAVSSPVPQARIEAPPAERSVASPDRPERMLDDLSPEGDAAGPAVPSRLGGLRKLVTSMRERNLNKDEAAEGPDLDAGFERVGVRAAYPDSPLPDADSGARLTAKPEFLRPKPGVEGAKEKEVVRPTPSRRVNADPDEIQTLPSWRGQYRKKRYPPL